MITDYKGCNVFYKDVGEGPTLVFIHGFLENSEIWEFIVEELRTKNRCISIDLFGHGKTDGIDEDYSMDLFADLIKQVLDTSKVSRCFLFGHSMGGYAALAFAEKFPELLNGICLINSTALADDEERKLNRTRAMELVQKDKRTFISMSISNLFAPSNLLVYNKEINDLKKSAYKVPLNSIVYSLEGMKNRPDRSGFFKSLNTKKLVILGQSDAILPLNKQLNYLKGSTVNTKVLQGGHMLFIENKYELTYIIKHFIE